MAERAGCRAPGVGCRNSEFGGIVSAKGQCQDSGFGAPLSARGNTINDGKTAQGMALICIISGCFPLLRCLRVLRIRRATLFVALVAFFRLWHLLRQPGPAHPEVHAVIAQEGVEVQFPLALQVIM